MLGRIQDALGIISGLALLYAFLPYWKSIKQGIGKPKKATWLVWTLGDVVGLVGQIADHTASIILIGAVFCAGYTFLLSLKHGTSGWSRTDKASLTLSGLALVLWGIMHLVHMPHAPDYAIAFSMLALITGAWPTWESAWSEPQNEDTKAWIIFCVSSFVALFAIKHAAFADIVVPSTFMFIDGTTLAIVLDRTHKQRERMMEQYERDVAQW